MLEELSRQKVMQLATEYDGQPWICTVYFVVRSGNFYWLSFPERRHSRELAENSRVAIAIAVKKDLPVIGVQSEGNASVVDDLSEAEAVMALYIKKYGQGKQFMERFKAATNHHVLYRMVPRSIMIFDETSEAKAARQVAASLLDL